MVAKSIAIKVRFRMAAAFCAGGHQNRCSVNRPVRTPNESAIDVSLAVAPVALAGSSLSQRR
jgi:hypothetical protein